MKKLLLPVIIVLMLAATTHAFSFSAPDKTINVPTQGARDIILTLSSDTSEAITINLIDAKTWTSINQNLVNLQPGNKTEVILTISPFADTTLGLYRVTLMAESLTTKQKIRKDLFISIYKGEVVDIEKIVVAGDTKPTGNVSVTVIVKNYKTVTSNEVVVNAVVSSPTKNVFEFTEVIDNLDPDQKVSRTRTFNLGKYAEAGTYKVLATLVTGNETREVTQTFNVAAKPVIVTTEEKTPLLFGFSKRITITNDGNEIAPSVTATNQVSGIEGIFYSGADPTTKENGIYTWTIKDLAPGQTSVIEYRIDYTALFMFIVALIIIFWILFFKLRTVRIKKYIMQKKELEEGEEFTVGIEVKNASGKTSDEITVRDFVPPVFEFRSAQTPEPTKKKTAAGVELTWKLKNVHHREERLVSYKIVPLFGAHGQIRLPRAGATFKWNKRDMTNRSTFAVIGIATEPESQPKEKKGKK